MEFFTNMVNLLIGIAGGIFSSIIVSRIFLIVTAYQEQLRSNRTRFEPFYGIMIFLQLVQKGKTPIDIKQANEFIAKYLEDALFKFKDFLPWDYKFELWKVLCRASEYASSNFSIDLENKKEVETAIEEIQGIIKDFEKCENTYSKGCMKRILHDKVLRILCGVLIGLIVITIIAYFIGLQATN